jgi:addiction module RelE/StbE family toxin
VAKVVWIDEALNDLESIYLFIARDAPRPAALFVDAILRATERLELFPLSGRIVPEYHDPSIRELIVQSYRLVYRVEGDLVELAMIHHAAQPLPDISP